MLDNLAVVLAFPKFPENVGACARACANMGCSELIVVQPQLWDMDKALALATPKGAGLLSRMRVTRTLAEALSDFSRVYGTTARTGGWRKTVSTPAQAAPEICERLADGERVALVFGAEDCGLSNEDIRLCGQLLCIPTATEASSLNLAQAVLLVLYECLRHNPGQAFRPAGRRTGQPATHAECETLFQTMQLTLQRIGFLKGNNIEYWMLPIRRFFSRIRLQRSEFNLIMGVCRQIDWLARQLQGKGVSDAPKALPDPEPGADAAAPSRQAAGTSTSDSDA